MEDNSITVLGKDRLTEMCIEFNSIIERSGRWAGVYANKNWFDNYLHKDIIKAKYTTWIAHYGVNEEKYRGEYDILQYSESGNIAGIGKVDMNIMYRNLISEIAGNKPVEPQVTKSIVDLANEVIAGVYENGEERKQALGSLYDEVQAKVNEMVGTSYYPACNSKYVSIVDALNSIGVDSSFGNRKAIAQRNNVHDYSGTATQNNQLLAKLKAGKLKK